MRYPLFLFSLLVVLMAACQSNSEEIYPDLYKNLNQGGNVKVIVVTAQDSLIKFQGQANDFGLIYKGLAEQPLLLSLTNTSSAFATYFSMTPSAEVSFQKDSSFALSGFRIGAMKLQFPGFNFQSDSIGSGQAGTISFSNIAEKNQKTTVTLILNAPFSNGVTTSLPVKSIYVEAETFLIP